MSRLQVHISINALRHSRDGWGDLAYAEALAAALQAKGHGTALFYREEQPDLLGTHDVVLRIVGPHLEDPVEGIPNFLWMISPPNLSPSRTLGRYQGLFIASQHSCQRLAEADAGHRILPPVHYLPQATDTELFSPSRRPSNSADLPLVFVGNQAPRAPRTNVLQAIELGYEVAIWGQGWDGLVPPRMLQGTRVSAEELAALYARAQVVLNSHMPHMSVQGFMSNRSFDALACGATVVSDWVAGFADPALPGLVQAGTLAELDQALRHALDNPPDAETRQARHRAIRAGYSFAARAEAFIAAAQAALDSGKAAPRAFAFAPPPKARPAGPSRFASLAASPSDIAPGDIDPERLAAEAASHNLHLTVRAMDPTATAEEDPRLDMRRAAEAVLRLCRVLSLRRQLASLSVQRTGEARLWQIHAMQADLRQAQALFDAPEAEVAALAPTLAARARRLLEAFDEPLRLATPPLPTRSLIRVLRGAPLHEHSPLGFDRDRQKRHLLLWPRQQSPAPSREIGVFLHLYYAELAPHMQHALSRLTAAHRLYITTDTETKAEQIAQSFPSAEIRVLPNRGRDIWPKLYGFADVYSRHDLVLHLHGKRSRNAQRLDGWLEHILASLLPEPPLLNRLISLFETVPKLGIIAPLAYRNLLAMAHWGDNFDIARELAHRMALPQPLPGNDALDFPAGSMFWARTDALRPLLDLRLAPEAFPPEQGQIDGTPAHAIERLYGPVCQQQGYELVPVAPPGSTDWPSHRLTLRRNGELRDALDRGRFQTLPL